jgi:hypothetical protein
MLKFPGAWRFKPPADNDWINQSVPEDAVREFRAMIDKTATQGSRQSILEHFKGYFCGVVGEPHVWSSSESWADTDLSTYMSAAAKNAPLFLEAFHDACESLRKHDDLFAPDTGMINEVCDQNSIGYIIEPPKLVPRSSATLVEVPKEPPSLEESAVEIYQQSLKRSEELLRDGHGREAVQEMLWLLESVVNGFKGLETGSDTIQGKYFNQIVKDLRRSHSGTALDRVLEWTTALHGYLSSPTGGGVRHGIDLKAGIALEVEEARLFCNLMRSYLGFLLARHAQLTRIAGTHPFMQDPQ